MASTMRCFRKLLEPLLALVLAVSVSLANAAEIELRNVQVLLLQPGKVAWAHCGDSRLYRFRGDKPFFRTIDHSYVEHLIAEGKITPEQALVHPNRNILLTSMGGGEPPKITYGEAVDLQGGDSFLLCSDGLWGYFSDLELAGIVAAFTAREAVRVLVERARSRASGEGDNLSAAILKLVEVPEKKK